MAASNNRAEPPTLDEIKTWPATVGIPRAGSSVLLSRSRSYELAKAGKFPFKTIQVGSTLRVLTSDILAVLDPKPASDDTSTAA